MIAVHRAFAEAEALPRLKELLWLLAPYSELQIIVAECLVCTLHRLVDSHSQYRCAPVQPAPWACCFTCRWSLALHTSSFSSSACTS